MNKVISDQSGTRHESVVTDPVCGMQVEPSTAAGKYEYNGQTYFFCSHHCLAKFKQDPEQFLNGQVHGHAGHAPVHEHEHADPKPPKTDRAEHGRYVCPMDPEVREAKPGACPKCGMALEPAALTAPAT